MSSKPGALAVVTGSELVWLDSKQATAAPLSRTTLATPTAFAADGPTVYVAFAHGVAKYGRDSGVHLFSHGQSEEASALCVGDSGAVFVARANSIFVYDPGSIEPAQTLEGHSSPITSLALSNDGTALASTSKTVHVHNLSTQSRTILRGLPCPNAVASCATFHPSRPNTLFVAISRQLVIYDTTKPAGPAKVVQIGGSASGDIVGIDCSPFSRSLLAVACSGGIVGIVDLDKEKPLVKTIDTKARLTSLRFQPDAAVIVVGTADGRLQYHDLRATDKQPNVVTVDKHGGSILGLAWPKQSRHASKPSVASTIKAPIPSSKSAVLQERRSPGQTAGAFPKGKSTSPTSTATLNSVPKTLFSPAKEAASRPAFAVSKSAPDAAARTTRAAKENAPTSRPSPTLRVSPPKPTSSLKPPPVGTRISPQLKPVAQRAERKPRTSSSSQASTRILASRRVSSATTSSRTSGLLSPSFPSQSDFSSSPHRNADSKRREVQALGLGTPGPRRQAARHSPSVSPTRSTAGRRGEEVENEEGENDTVIQFAAAMAREPDRVPSSASTAESISTDNVPTVNNQLSPTRRPPPFVDMSPVRSAMNGSPQASLRAFMQELATKDDIKGLHMDLIRMGMAWKSEMRSLMDQYVGDLSSLRQENMQLREELQRLRNRY
ncbi:WD40 repeat-like protein [Auricularia subglabra TFB-10046 SS5]|nr:WD40 repeat-like protein [Auricularia subglabra TFB-10046 SS5]